MNYLHIPLLLLALVILPATKLSAQCEPDTANCTDTGDPGQICPPNMPPAVVNELYDEVITVIPPDTAHLEELGLSIALAYIMVDSVINVPPGLDYFPNAAEFYPDSVYCIQVTGTPTTAGDYPLKIYVSAFVNAGAGLIVKAGQVADSTSVVMTVNETAGLDPRKFHEFHLLPAAPNPFTGLCRLGFYTPFDSHVKLQVYSILGELVHEEVQGAPPGENFFDFNGSSLLPGTYFYRVSNRSDLFTGKFIKAH